MLNIMQWNAMLLLEIDMLIKSFIYVLCSYVRFFIQTMTPVSCIFLLKDLHPMTEYTNTKKKQSIIETNENTGSRQLSVVNMGG